MAVHAKCIICRSLGLPTTVLRCYKVQGVSRPFVALGCLLVCMGPAYAHTDIGAIWQCVQFHLAGHGGVMVVQSITEVHCCADGNGDDDVCKPHTSLTAVWLFEETNLR